MEFLPLLIAIAVIYLFIKAIKDTFFTGGKISEKGNMVCPQCGTRGFPQTVTKGSLMIEIILWICFIVPGLVYSIWRLNTRYEACPSCRHTPMISADSPIGKKMTQ